EIEPEHNAEKKNLFTFLFKWNGNWKLTRISFPNKFDATSTTASSPNNPNPQLSIPPAGPNNVSVVPTQRSPSVAPSPPATSASPSPSITSASPSPPAKSKSWISPQ